MITGDTIAQNSTRHRGRIEPTRKDAARMPPLGHTFIRLIYSIPAKKLISLLKFQYLQQMLY